VKNAGFQATEAGSQVPMRYKYACGVLCALGLCGTAYGMEQRNHPVFVLGLLCVIAGYLWIRRYLKKGTGTGADRG
jgi:hypothetical protein